ncbi:MAG: response regulator transcription factor [Acholeplasmataceae bacterium]|nr:response regulator transcription factor [Acholeplasmataceae bacterium]
MTRILIVEDDLRIQTLLQTFLSRQGFEIIKADDGKKGLDVFKHEHVDLVITDVMMPLMDGHSLVSAIRSYDKTVPLLMLTALGGLEDKTRGFEGGVDDYMVKPIDLNELLLRIKALLRRYGIVSAQRITLEHTVLDASSLTCTVDGIEVSLTPKAFRLLFKLLASDNTIFTREQLMNEIWGYDSESYDRTVDTHIKRLREHVKSDDFEIVTVRGLGYKAVIR